MVYKNYRNASQGVPLNTPIWGFAYTIDNNTNTSRLRATPVLGEIRADGWQKRFIPYRKDGTVANSYAVHYFSRQYADTKEEAVKAYNELVQARIDKLKNLIADAEKDFLPIDAK